MQTSKGASRGPHPVPQAVPFPACSLRASPPCMPAVVLGYDTFQGQEFPDTGTHALSQEEWCHVHLERVSCSEPHMNSGELCGLLWHSSAHHANVFCYSYEQKRRTLSVKAFVEQC
ncbi:unnamed protein product [Rangifer tarandus platyrhynchus]|uniref:Uncharacterized protein n=1 Tax=Rangifer tarandus platyrhynchus TaxID=3082113 RepID=A0AC60A689_RANTA